MKVPLSTLLLSSLLVSCGFAANVDYRYLGRIETTNPAFLSVEKFPGQPEFLLISSFAALSSGSVSVIPDIASTIKNLSFAQAKAHVLANTFKWPNEVRPVPQDVFGSGVNAIVVPDGFLPPGKTEGNVFVITTDPKDVTVKEQVYKISAPKSGYFYHMGVWIDMDGDGRKDYLTARTNAKAGQGQLVWYQHPAQGLQQVPWAEQVITQGPDVMFEVHDNIPNYEGKLIVFAAEFFTHRLTVYEVSKGGPTAGQVLNSKIIDSTLDQAYSVKYVDINGDGKHQLLVNNHESDNTKAAIFLYDVPSDLFNANYTKRVIANGFKNAFSLFIPNMCPGFPYVVYPTKGSKAHILVAGDGDYSAHLMRPDGTGNFKREVIKNLGGTVGSLAAYDFGNDGNVEFFVPNYDKNYIEVYQFFESAATFLE
jgi:hypothetical protein